jgi:hypothetical protein
VIRLIGLVVHVQALDIGSTLVRPLLANSVADTIGA